MNENDSQIVASILQSDGYVRTAVQSEAELVLLNTCAIRANAESKVFTRLGMLKALKRENPGLVVGVLGCMAERLKETLWEHGADIVVGPDSYRQLPRLIGEAGRQSDTQLSWDETYEDLMPMVEQGTYSQYVSIMRGCNNMCSFCIVPFTRGRERSRSPSTILNEVETLQARGIREITLLGQNVNSYFYRDEEVKSSHANAQGFSELYKLRGGNGVRFASLLQSIAERMPMLRIRFTSPHPKDFSDDVIDTIARYPNIARSIHIPAQSGSTTMLARMRRNYTREALLELCQKIRTRVPGVALSTDLIVGFCDESEEEFADTLSLVDTVRFEQAYMFAYSMRERTHAHRNYVDSVPEAVKQERLLSLIDRVHHYQLISNLAEVGREHIVLVDGVGKYANQLKGRTDHNKTVILSAEGVKQGDFVQVRVDSATLKSLMATTLRVL